MRTTTFHKYISLLLAALLLVTSAALCFAAGPVDLDEPIELTINLATESGPIRNAHFRVYRVANSGVGGNNLYLIDELKDIPIDMSDLDDPNLVNTLKGYIDDLGIKPVGEGSTDNNGVTIVEGDIRAGLYLIEGDPVKTGRRTYTPVPYLMKLPLRAEDDTWRYIATSDAKYEFKIDPYSPEKIDLTIQKVWMDDLSEHEPIKVKIYGNKSLVKEVELSAANNWKEVVKGLSASKDYSIKEEFSGEGYTVSVNREGNVFTVTNKKEGVTPPPTDPDNPTPTPPPTDPTKTDTHTEIIPPTPGGNVKTGTYSYLIPIIGTISALLLFAGGAMLSKKDRNEAEA